MKIVRSEDRTPLIAPDGSEVRELIGPPSRTASNQSLAEATLRPGAETREHFHEYSEEIYVFLSGQGRMRLDGQEHPVRAGESVAIPPGAPHKLWSTGAEPLVLLCCCSPPYSDEDTIICDEDRG